jgi:hypothetical protein
MISGDPAKRLSRSLRPFRIIPRMRTTWSGLAKDWEGFRFVGYSLSERILEIQLKCVTDGKLPSDAQQVTLRELIEQLKERHFQVSQDAIMGFTISLDDKSISVSGPSFNVDLAHIILKLSTEGKSHFGIRFFYYSKASCLTDPHERYEFFLTEGEEIIRESVTFSDYHGSGFDPAVFESFEDLESLWSDEDNWRRASDALLYRKFYSTTRTGQLMVLRPDKPQLHYITREDASGSVLPRTAHSELKRPLWAIAILLAVIAWLMIGH